MNRKIVISFLLAAVSTLGAVAQEVQGFVHRQSDASGYEWPTDTAVLTNLERWRDQKFGVLFHMGLYSVPGIVESWSICSEDVDWIGRNQNMPYDEYKRWYYALADSLNPTDFNPDEWARIMKDAGMRYMIFTTKHHDGFCMYDSKYTDFSIAKAGPFAGDERRDFARHVFDSFRNEGFMTGAYFSKPDWHCEWFWNPYFATPNRHINYKKERHPDWWKNYQDFTANQLDEILGGYGPFDIVWLDGGWITGDDIGLDAILERARKGANPGLISVDRSIKGRNENYQTPERAIPDVCLDYPWESCITLSNDWGWVPNAPYKSPEKVIALLAEATAKGGCLLLGVGPTARGTIEPAVEERLQKVGEWLRRNGGAIYSTRTTERYVDGDIWFTRSKDGKTRYAVYAWPDGAEMPSELTWTGNLPKGRLVMLDGNRKLSYKVDGDRVTVKLPKDIKPGPVALRFTPAK
ncbi:MAG: alpha-L-fucosidase [Paramuribaculum sp.]|nr:alpha-L-fucosidase [Paramuribaculum sp.]